MEAVMPKVTHETPMERRGYRVGQWCEAHQTSRAKAYELMSAGKLKFKYIGGRRWISNEAADEYLASGD
jgi:predicted site-specific integrase-resolvase